MHKSLWAETKLPKFPALAGDLTTDVLIVGGGLAGLLCAYELKQTGADCALIEADRICGGVTGNTTAKITSQHSLIYGKLLKQFGPDAARRYWQANQEALARYRRLAGSLDCDFETRDNFVYCLDDSGKLEKEKKALDELGIPAELTRDTELPFPVAGAIRFRDQASFHPLKFAAAIARELPIYEHTGAREFGPGWVTTDRGTIRANKIIVATHFPILNKHGGYYIKMYQQRSYMLALENAPLPEGMYLGEGNGLSFRRQGELLLLGGGGHRTGKKGGGWAELEAFARQNYPNARVRYRWAAQDCMTLDGVPYIGRYGRNTPGLFVATGFNKWGMTSSMVAAMVLGDLVQGKGSPYEALFSPQRTSLRPQLAANICHAALNLLTPTVPRCPHMGCALKWNPQEHSWDCPCHGSRFTERGTLLDGPATGDKKL